MLMHNWLVAAGIKQRFCGSVLNTSQLPVLRVFYFMNKK